MSDDSAEIEMRWLTRENQNRVDSHDPPYERILQYRYMIENKWSQWMDVREEKECQYKQWSEKP